MRHPACRANEASSWFACLAPGRTPKAIVARTSQAWKTFDASALRRRQRRKRSASAADIRAKTHEHIDNGAWFRTETPYDMLGWRTGVFPIRRNKGQVSPATLYCAF